MFRLQDNTGIDKPLKNVYMEMSLSLEAASRSAAQEFPNIS
jgi:hypothetical protein